MDSYDAALLERAQGTLYPNYQQPQLLFVKGKGAELFDQNGKRYLDLYAGIAVSALGHAHPALVEAISAQAARVIHLSNYFYNAPNLELAARLVALSGMDRAFFCNSGAEAIEAALKLVRRHFFNQGEKDRFRIVAFEGSFHGRTLGALAATGQAKYRDGFGPLPGVTHVPYGDLDAVRRALAPDVAAILVEPIQGEGGVVPAPAGFLQALRALSDEKATLLIFDEIQTGIGRTGAFLASEHEGVKPDVLVLAKALGGGVPIGCMLCKEALVGALPTGSHGSTFGGNPLASAAALAVLDVIEAQGLVAAAARLGAHLGERLAALKARHPKHVRDVRGRGLLQAVELAEGLDARAVMGKLREAGVLLTLAGGRSLRFSPALTITEAELDEGVDKLAAVLDNL